MLGQLCRRLGTWKKHVVAADGHAYRLLPAATGTVVTQPHKRNADRRHHIPKMSFKVQNWPAYEAGLRRRGSLTLSHLIRTLRDFHLYAA
jgi:hypothetical protein